MSTMGYAMLSLLAGLGIPVMAALNGRLGMRLGSTAAAAVALFLVGLAVSAVVLAVIGMPRPQETPPPLYFMGGVLVAFYMLAITWIVPRFGVGDAIFFVLLGQLCAAAAIDHTGALARLVLRCPRRARAAFCS